MVGVDMVDDVAGWRGGRCGRGEQFGRVDGMVGVDMVDDVAGWRGGRYRHGGRCGGVAGRTVWPG